MFYDCISLVGQTGKVYDENYVDHSYAYVGGYLSNKHFTTLMYGEGLCGAIKRASNVPTTENSVVTKVVFDYFRDENGIITTEKVYYVDGINVLIGLDEEDVSVYATQDAFAYTKRDWEIVYVLSSKEMYMNDNASYTFYNLTECTTIIFNNFNTSKVTNMSYMFCYCGESASSLNLDLTNFDTSRVTDMSAMFMYCGYSVAAEAWNVDMSSFKTSNVTNMNAMFSRISITTNRNRVIDLSSFDTSKVYNMAGMFSYNPGLTTIYVSNRWTNSAVTNTTNMFYQCSSLVGGEGTVYNANYVTISRAKVDGGTGSPGYFTYKAAPTESASEGESEKVVAFRSFAVAIFGVVAFVWFYLKKKTGRFIGRMNK
ncbi:MAG: BspA family leucine-rich repeat surface protein [Clostridia bacterium]|nr:BspA family leucine-rich repeat surface protein [Clostridia bacterium]